MFNGIHMCHNGVTYPSINIRRFVSARFTWHYTCSGYNSNEVPSDNTLHTIKSTNDKPKIASGYNVYSGSTDEILICTNEV